MHPNPAYRKESEAQNIDFARSRGFGVLAVAAENAPLISHIPFILSPDGGCAEFHLVRSNPIVRLLSAPLSARLAVQGAHSYISPDWYGADDQVPTWNYVAVHLLGQIEQRPQDELRNLLDRQAQVFEAQLAPKPEWTTAKMTPDVLDRMMRQIVPCRMQVARIEGTWKLGQNKTDTVRLGAAAQVGRFGLGSELEVLAALMQAGGPG